MRARWPTAPAVRWSSPARSARRAICSHPLGPLTEDDAVEIFVEQIEGLKEGGADVVWIETMSAVEEMRAAAKAAVKVGMPYTVTASFDTAGKTMMGIPPAAMPSVAGDIDPNPVAVGANCGVGASDLLVSILSMTEANPDADRHRQGQCGHSAVPRRPHPLFRHAGTDGRICAPGVDAGARIIGGCCGTSPAHLAAMRKAIDSHAGRARPDTAKVIAEIGPLVAPPKAAGGRRPPRRTAAGPGPAKKALRKTWAGPAWFDGCGPDRGW